MHKIIPTVLACAALTACDGTTITTTDNSSSSSSLPSSSASSYDQASSSSVSAAPTNTVTHRSLRGLKQLGTQEYYRSIEVLLDTPLPPELKQNQPLFGRLINGFRHGTPYSAGASKINALFDTASTIAESPWLLQSIPKALRDDRAIFKQYFLHSFLFMAFRRPPTQEEATHYADLIDHAASNDEAIQFAMMAALSAPQFIYRSELGTLIDDVISSGWENFPSNKNTYATGADFQLFNTEKEITASPSVVLNAEISGAKWLRFNFKPVNTDKGLPITVLLDGIPVGDYVLPHGAVQSPPVLINAPALDTAGAQHTVSLQLNASQNSHAVLLTLESTQITSAIRARAPVTDESNSHISILGKRLSSDGSTYVLDPFEYATHLAFMYTGRTPEPWLLHAALKGQLDDLNSTKEIIAQLINSSAAKEHIGDFAQDWVLGANEPYHSQAQPLELGSDLWQLLKQEVKEQFWHVFYSNELPLSEYFTADYTFVNKDLASYYDDIDDNLALDDQFVKVATTRRGGPIASGAFMALGTFDGNPNPIRRAARLRTRFFCQHSAAEPNIPGEFERLHLRVLEAQEAEQGLTHTRYYELFTDAPICNVCHQYAFTALFAMNDFDASGQLLNRDTNGTVWQTVTWEGLSEDKPIEAMDRGIIYGLEDGYYLHQTPSTSDSIPFSGAKDLSEKIASHPTVERCMIKNALEFTESRHFVPLYDPGTLNSDQKNTRAIIDDLHQEFVRNNKSISAVFSAIGTTDIIRFRTNDSTQ